MKTGKLLNITNIREIEEGLNQLELEMDDFSSYILFGNLKDYIEFVDKDIEFETRKDLVNGLVEEVISTISVRSVVQSIGVTDDDVVELETSLIPDESKTVSVVTFDHKLLKRDDVALAQIIYISSYKNGKSKIAKWTDFECIDINSQAFNLRLFTNDDDIEEFRKNVVGKYVLVDIKHDSRFGFQVFKDMEVYDQEVLVPPEVFIAAFKLSIVANRDELLKGYVDKYNVIEHLKGVIYFEPGYHLVEMQAEIMLINYLMNIFKGYDRDLLYRAVFASRGYLYGNHVELSNTLTNYHRLITSDLRNDTELIKLIDFSSGIEEGDVNKQAYLQVRRMVTSIMKGRRGINEESIINDNIRSIDVEYGGLFQRGLIE